ncbi:hypothetical protein [Rufibacter immobilis]|uniref:hypothetical protein n=1 Tax=Rufibacter immobilis TaxID=1348778 RepID=UPI0035E75BA0
MEDYSHLVGDCRIDRLSIDFNSDTVIFVLSRYRDKLEKIVVRFGRVINHDFKTINKDNIIFGIEETDWEGLESEFPDLMKWYKHYKRITPEEKELINSGVAKCFHIRGTTGLEGYIIAETIKIEEITSANTV